MFLGPFKVALGELLGVIFRHENSNFKDTYSVSFVLIENKKSDFSPTWPPSYTLFDQLP